MYISQSGSTPVEPVPGRCCLEESVSWAQMRDKLCWLGGGGIFPAIAAGHPLGPRHPGRISLSEEGTLVSINGQQTSHSNAEA